MNELLKRQLDGFVNKYPDKLGALAWILSKLPKTEIRNEQNLTSAHDWLDHGSLFVYVFPHDNILQPIIVTQRVIIEKIIGRSFVPYVPFAGKPLPPEKLTWIGSPKFTGDIRSQGDGDIGIAARGAQEYAKLIGFETEPGFTQEQLRFHPEAHAKNLATGVRVRRRLKTRGNIVAAFPEGTREKVMGITRAYEGLGTLTRPVKTSSSAPDENISIGVLPIIVEGAGAIQPYGKKDFDDFHPRVPVVITAGHILTYKDAVNFAEIYYWKDTGENLTISDAYMFLGVRYMNTRSVNGKDPRGIYSWDNLALK